MRNYDPADTKIVSFKLKDIGLGPAGNVTISYDSSTYKSSGFSDKEIHNKIDDSAIIYRKFTVDVPNEDYVDILLKLRFSNQMKKSIHTGCISLTFDYQDIRNNKIQRTMSIDLGNGDIWGRDSQKYTDARNQALFDGTLVDM